MAEEEGTPDLGAIAKLRLLNDLERGLDALIEVGKTIYEADQGLLDQHLNANVRAAVLAIAEGVKAHRERIQERMDNVDTT